MCDAMHACGTPVMARAGWESQPRSGSAHACACAQEGLFEEAQLLREREVEMKARLGGPPGQAPALPVVGAEDVEAVVSAWTGIPVDRMSADEAERLTRMEPALQVGLLVRWGCPETVGLVEFASGLLGRQPRVSSTCFESVLLPCNRGPCLTMRWHCSRCHSLAWRLPSMELLLGQAMTCIRTAKGLALPACLRQPLSGGFCRPASAGAHHRPGRGGGCGGARDAPRARRPEGPRAPHCGHALCGAHRRGQDRAHQGADTPCPPAAAAPRMQGLPQASAGGWSGAGVCRCRPCVPSW